MTLNIRSFEYLVIRQLCRIFTYKTEMDSAPPECCGPKYIYSLEFIKSLYDKPKENIDEIINSGNDKEMNPNDYNMAKALEKKTLLNYFKTVNDMKSMGAKQWTDLQHYLCFIYRNCLHNMSEMHEFTVNSNISTYFISEMRSIVLSLMEQDEVQLLLRLFSSIREFTIYALKQYQRINNLEISMENLFYYYEAFLAATKNICKIFPELENLLFSAYKLGFVDLNASIFMHYFYESPYVKEINKEFESIKDSMSIKATGVHTVLMELHRLWRSQIIKTSGIIANKLGTNNKSLDRKSLATHKNILMKNFWIDRSKEEMLLDDKELFGFQLFSLIGDKSIMWPEPTLNECGHCICEECLLIKYKSLIENCSDPIGPDYTQTFCRLCKKTVNFEHLLQHGTVTQDSTFNEKNFIREPKRSEKIPKDTSNMDIRRNKHNSELNSSNSNENGMNYPKEPSPKLASEPPVLSKTFDEKHKSKVHRKTFYNLIKQSESFEKTTQTPVNGKTSETTFSCGHLCKHEEEMKSGVKACENHKDASKCDCTFCEVFGTSSHVKHNETRNRLRIRLNQRNEKIGKKLSQNNTNNTNNNTNNTSNVQPTKNVPKTVQNKSEIPTAKGQLKPVPRVPEVQNASNNDENTLINQDIHGLVNYIEGNTNNDKMALAEKKAAKKARQRMKREEEKKKLEEEEKRKAEEEKRKLEDKRRQEEIEKQLAEKALKKELKKKKQKIKKEAIANKELVEETIPAMVTIKRIPESNSSVPTVTITLKSSTPDQDKLLYSLVNGHESDNNSNDSKKNKKNKNNQPNGLSKTVNLKVNPENNDKKKTKGNKNTTNPSNSIITKELKVTLEVDPVSNNQNNNNNNTNSKKNKNTQNNTKLDGNKQIKNNKKEEQKKDKQKSPDLNIPMLKLPPGITITKVDGPMTDRQYKSCNVDNPSFNSNIPVSKSGVIVVDTEKLIKQSSALSQAANSSNGSKKNKKKKNKKPETTNSQPAATQENKPKSMITLKNPIFQSLQQQQQPRHEPDIAPEMANGHCQQAAIFRSENGMVTIRSSRLQQSLTNGTPMPNLLSDLKPVLGPEVPTSYMSNCTFSEPSTFNAQEILSGLPGIEITKVDKRSTKQENDNKKAFHTAEVSIIPANNIDKFHFDKDDLHYENVFRPKDILEDDMDADERELEAFKRFCQQSIPPKRKEKVAHLNVKDIVLKKKNDKIPG